MKKACLVVPAPYDKAEIFNQANKILNRDNSLDFYCYLKSFFLEKNIDLSTHDVYAPADCEIVIYNEMPSVLPPSNQREKSFLFLFESELIRPDNWDLQNHHNFSKIFTWHDDFVDNKKYFKMNFVSSSESAFVSFHNKRFCTLIAGNKSVNHPLELYSERRKSIRWFEERRPENFEFYGANWDQYIFKGPVFIRALNRVPGLGKCIAEKWPSYRGKIERKLDVLKNYKFSICYENAKDIPGYVTEKIFDSLAAGCIPVYWGAPNITDYVDENCFIDRKKFASHEALYKYLSTMTEAQYNEKIEAIKRYFVSEKYTNFIPERVAKKIVENIVGV